jgi:hypothetical protein
MDQSRVLFERFTADRYTQLERVRDEQWQETLWLEFKANRPPGSPGRPDQNVTDVSGSMTRGGRQYLAMALSGFANADGGVLVWGVSCRENQGIDAVDDLRPIHGLRRFHSDLHSLTDQIVSPPVEGVQHELIELPGQDDTGFVATHVPKDEARLHMAIATDQHCFYRRDRTGFRLMEEYEIAAGYARRPAPKLELVWEFQEAGRSSTECQITVRLGIFNSGLALAHYPALAVYRAGAVEMDLTPGRFGGHGCGLTQRSAVQRSRVIDGVPASADFYAGGPDVTLYAGTTLWVARTQPKSMPLDRFVQTSMLITYELSCDGFYHDGQAQITQARYQEFWNQLRASR